MTKHAGIATITYKLLAQQLDLPEGARITGIHQSPGDQLHGQFRIKVTHPSLPFVAEGAEIPEVDIETIRRTPAPPPRGDTA